TPTQQPSTPAATTTPPSPTAPATGPTLAPPAAPPTTTLVIPQAEQHPVASADATYWSPLPVKAGRAFPDGNYRGLLLVSPPAAAAVSNA
ncbi:MAG: hypothetical protein LBC29_03565, partial [Propionibacteriaceae bacterium]|nr:hypothetical protein [Propionibacteriaceae bacterium]